MALVTVQRSPTPSTSSSPCVSESGSGEDDRRSQPRSISESFLTVKGAALFLPRGNGSSASSASRFSQLRSKHAGDIQQHLQTMFTVLRPEDNIKLAVRLESAHVQVTRYMVVVSTNGRQDTEESVVLGMDFSPVDGSCSVGLVLPLWSDTLIHLDGDGGFSVSTDNRVHVFKPVSVQAMWSALQSLHKACEVARCHNYFPGSLFLTWVSYYQSRVSSDQARINEWNVMQDVQSHRADSPVLFSDVPTERELTERQIKTSLREIMMQKDLENVTCKEIRTELEMHMTCNLREFKEFIDNEMILILGQMDSPTEIFDHVFLGSEWNASNLEELQKSGVQYILNVTREIDNFFPGVFEYHNIRVYDEEATDLLAYWNDTFKFISRAKKSGARCLVHCKMGISRSAATVIAYAMKEYGWDLKKAFDYVKERRTVTKPNPSFMRQLEEYQGILLASKQRHNKLWRSHSDSDLSEHHEPLSKSHAQPHTLGRSDPHNQSGGLSGPSVNELLESLGTTGGSGRATHSASQPDTGTFSTRSNSSPFENPAAEARSPSVPAPTAGSVSPPVPNGLCFPSQPRAAAVVPEPPKADLATVAQSVSLAQSPTGADEAGKAQASSCAPLGIKPTSVPTPAHGPPCSDGDQQTRSSSLDSLAAHASSNETTSHPSAIPQDNVLLFGHGADHINFFSAREKFKGMSQDGRNPSTQLPPLLKLCDKEPQSAAQEMLGGDAKEAAKDIHIPVQVAGPKLAETVVKSEPPSSQNQEVTKRRQETEDQDVLLQTDAENVKEEAKNKEEEAPARLHSDWRRGSVRRATQQLEQRMKQDHEAPSPSSSPPSFSGSSSGPQRRPHSMHATPPREEQKVKKAPPLAARTGNQGQNDKSTKAHKLQPAENKFLSTSSFHHSVHSPFASINFLCLEGVTELESGTDWDCFTEGPHADVVMRETWETLCELRAFLQQVSAGGACKIRLTGQAPPTASRASSIQKRVREVEARIRQAGLTPPSLMKRSASLAKLGCLELLANDLNEWELSRCAPAPPSAQTPAHALSDESKKQKVHNSASMTGEKPDALGAASTGRSKADESSPGAFLPTNLKLEKETPPNSGKDFCNLPGPTLFTSRQQYGRTHPLRRLKKRTVSTLYHTM